MQIVENNQKVRFSQDIRVEQRFSNIKGIKILKWSQVLPARYSSSTLVEAYSEKIVGWSQKVMLLPAYRFS